MVIKRRIISKVSKPVVSDPEEEDEVEVPVSRPSRRTEEAPISKTVRPDPDEDDYAADDEEEDEDPVPPVVKRREVAPKVEEVDDEEDEDPPFVIKRKTPVPESPKVEKKVISKIEEDEEDLVDTFRKDRPLPTRPSKHIEEEEEEEDKEILLKKTGSNPIGDMLEHMEVGKVLLVTKQSDSSWTIALSTQNDVIMKLAKSGTNKLTGKAFFDEVINPEYLEWRSEWKELTYAQKKSKALKLGVTWNEHPNPKVDVMRITEAVRKHLNVQKYKEEYRSRSVRGKLRA